MNDMLKNISKTKLEYVEKCKIKRPLAEVEGMALKAPPVRGFINSLHLAKKAGNFGLITEIKKASPSKGLIRKDFNPKELAKAYELGGASCLSVLTDTPYFMGKDKHLVDARAATALPVLRKDFILDPYQIIESRALGADCILIIMAMVDDTLAAELETVALEYNLDVLVEVHDANELKRSQKLESQLVGINNRNLKTFDVSIETTIDLASLADPSLTLVSESGFFLNSDLKMINEKANINTFLIGESLMRQNNVKLATQKLLCNS